MRVFLLRSGRKMRHSRVCQRGRFTLLRNRLGRLLSSRRHLCRSHSARREAGRSPGAVSGEIRDGRQPQDRQGAWTDGAAIDLAARRRGDRMIKRRQFIVGLGGVVAWPVVERAQRTQVIGILGSATADANPGMSAFMQGLKDTGFVEGQNIAIVAHWANNQYDRLSAMAAELVRARVALIATIGNNLPARAAKNATSTIPIVFYMGADPVQLGIVDGLSRPGGNITGVTVLAADQLQKRLQLLHDAVPASVWPHRQPR
jgi:ABC transporter substrate binding protein